MSGTRPCQRRPQGVVTAASPLTIALLTIALLIAILPGLGRAYEMRFNCGSSPESTYVDGHGHVFIYDDFYTPQNGAGRIGGFDQNHWQPIGGTPDPDLYLTTRNNWAEYRFDVPSGSYLVKLRFADIKSHGPGQRIFNIAIEGQVVLDHMDLYAQVGDHYAIDYTIPVQVNDDQLNITATVIRQLVQLNAIEVWSQDSDTDPPAIPTGLTIWPSYGRIMLDWADSPEPDLTGYYLERALAPEGPWQMLSTSPIRRSRAEDATAAPGVTYYYRVSAIDAWANEGAPTAPVSGQTRPDSATPLPIYQITISQANWDILNSDVEADVYVSGNVTYNGQTWTNVGLRYRGRTTRSVSKKSWKIKFNEFVPGQRFVNNQEEIGLDSQFGERTMIREALAWNLTKRAGVPDKKAREVQLRVNGEYYGVYTELEQVDARWLQNHGFNPSGDLYKANIDACLDVLPDSLYAVSYNKITNPASGYSNLIQFIQLVNSTPATQLYSTLAPIFDIEGFIEYLALMMAISDDSFSCHNYFLYCDLTTGKWSWLADDLDSTFGHLGVFEQNVVVFSSLLHGEDNRLIEKLHDIPHFRRRYIERTLELLSEDLSPAAFEPAIDSTFALMHEDGRLDWRKWGWEDPAWVDGAAAEVKGYIPGRQSYVALVADGVMPAQNLFINEFMADNDSTVQDEAGDFDDWIEIKNAGQNPLNLGGYFLTDDIAAPTKWAIPDTVLAPGAYILFWADLEPAEGPTHTNFRLERNGEFVGLFSPLAAGNQPVDTKGFGPQLRDVSFGRFPDASFNWTLMGTGTPLAANQGVGNLPPSITDVEHSPFTPALGVPVRITARIGDSNGILSALAYYDAGAPFTPVPMADDGTGGDLTPGDGVYTAMIPGQAAPMTVLYYVAARDSLGRGAYDPVDAPLNTHAYTVAFVPPPLYLNEFMADNLTTIPDEFGQYDDWVEIYNGGQDPIPLAGLRLSDNLTVPNRFIFPDTTLAPAAFLLVWCDNDPEQGPLHANFRLSATGEEVGIFTGPNLGYAIIDSLAFGPQAADVSQGRFPDGGPLWRFYSPASPREPNMTTTSGGRPEGAAPRVLVLGPSRPNPAPGRAVIPFGLPAPGGRATLVIYDAAGRGVARLLDRALAPGFHELAWDGRSGGREAPAGVYFYRLRAGGDERVGKLTLVR